MSNRKPLGFLLVLIIGALLPTLAIAQTPGTKSTPPQSKVEVIATVNIQNASLISQSGNELHITFDLTNREGVQAGVRYGVELIATTTKGQFTADEKVYPDTLTLGEHSTTHEDITYTAPASLAGTYSVVIVSRNESGLLLAIDPIGQATFAAVKATGVEILSKSCYLTVTGEKGSPHYTLAQGVDISADEILVLTCDATNHDAASVSSTPAFETHYRTSFGEEVPATGGSKEPITFAAGQTKTIALTLPRASAPQSYDVSIVLQANGTASNAITAHYVLRGASATIQTISLDKDVYQTGDTAHVTFIWSPSADSFRGSRAGTSSPSAASYTATLSDAEGTPCAASVTEPLAQTIKQTAQFEITKNCVDPQVSITLTDAHGHTLAQKVLALKSSSSSLGLSSTALFILALLLLLAVSIYVLWRKRGSSPPMLPLFIPLLFLGAAFMPLHQAQADTFTVYGGPYQLAVFTVHIDSDTYNPSETIVATGHVESLECGNSIPYAELDAAIPGWGSSQTLIAANILKVVSGGADGTGWYTAPSSPGRYEMLFTGTVSPDEEYFVGGTGSAAIPFTVVAPTPPTCAMSVDKSSIAPGETFKLSWTSTNATAGTLTSTGFQPGVSSPLIPAASGSSNQIVFTAPGSYTFTGTFTGADGTGTCSTGITVTDQSLPPPPPTTATVTLTVCDPFGGTSKCITNGQSMTVEPAVQDGAYWSTTNVHSCTLTGRNTDGQWNNLAVGAQNPSPGWGFFVRGSDPATVTLSCLDNSANNPVSASVTLHPSPPPPTNVAAICNANNTAAHITWHPVNASTGATGYRVIVNLPASVSSCPAGWVIETYDNSTQNYCNIYTGLSGDNGTVANPAEDFPTTPGVTYTSAWLRTVGADRTVQSGASNETPSFSCPASSSALPDLTATLSVPASAQVGVSTPLPGTIHNGGSVSTGAAFHNTYEINPNSIPMSFDAIATTIAANYEFSLGSNNTWSTSKSYSFSSPGDYYVRLCADKDATTDDGTIEESNENNNCNQGPLMGGWTKITVCPAGKVFQNGACVSQSSCTPLVTSRCIDNGDGTFTAENPSPSNACTAVDTHNCATCSIDNFGQAYCPSGPTLPTVTFTASPPLVHAGDTATLTWSVTSAHSGDEAVMCTASDPQGALDTDTGGDGFTKDVATRPIFAQTTFTLSCVGATDGAPLDPLTATVGLIPTYIEP